MADFRDDLRALLNELIANVRNEMQAQGVNASGRTSDSLRVTEEDTIMRVVAGGSGTHALSYNPAVWTFDSAPAGTLEIGRKGGKVPRGFYYIIKEWSAEKGLAFDSESERGRFAYFLANKIAREGTERNRNNIAVFSPLVVATADKVAAQYRGYIKAEVQAAILSRIGKFTKK